MKHKKTGDKMRTIERDTIGQMHESIIKEILLNGEQQESKHGITLEHPDGIDAKILKPFELPIKSNAYKLPFHAIEYYASQVLNILPKTNTNKDFDYNCGNRWFDFFTYSKDLISGYDGDGDSAGFNQIEFMIKKELTKDLFSRRAVVVSIFPPVDYYKKHIPCISFLQFLYRNNKLNLIVYIRSNDMLSAWGADAFALSKVLEYVAKELNFTPGYLEILSVSAHIYYKRDAAELNEFRKIIY